MSANQVNFLCMITLYFILIQEKMRSNHTSAEHKRKNAYCRDHTLLYLHQFIIFDLSTALKNLQDVSYFKMFIE